MAIKRISVLVSDDLRKKKAILGVNWRFAIEKGLEFLEKANTISNALEELEENKKKIAKMSGIIDNLIEKRNEYERKYGVM